MSGDQRAAYAHMVERPGVNGGDGETLDSLAELPADTGQRRPRRRRWLLGGGVLLVALLVAAVLVPRVLGSGPAGTSDSPSYGTFDDLAAASELFVRGDVVGSSSTMVEGTEMTSYKVRVEASTGEVGSTVAVLIPAVERAADATAESEPLNIGGQYVIALVPMGGDWQPTSRTQGVFAVVDGQVEKSSDKSLAVSQEVSTELGK